MALCCMEISGQPGFTAVEESTRYCTVPHLFFLTVKGASEFFVKKAENLITWADFISTCDLTWFVIEEFEIGVPRY